jgi:hypothetical protein
MKKLKDILLKFDIYDHILSRDACHATSNALEASIKTKYNGKLSSKASAMASVSNRPALVGGMPLVKPLCSLLCFI